MIIPKVSGTIEYIYFLNSLFANVADQMKRSGPSAIRIVKGGATVNATVDERDSDMGGGAVFHDNRVEIERL